MGATDFKGNRTLETLLRSVMPEAKGLSPMAIGQVVWAVVFGAYEGESKSGGMSAADMAMRTAVDRWEALQRDEAAARGRLRDQRYDFDGEEWNHYTSDKDKYEED